MQIASLQAEDVLSPDAAQTMSLRSGFYPFPIGSPGTENQPLKLFTLLGLLDPSHNSTRALEFV